MADRSIFQVQQQKRFCRENWSVCEERRMFCSCLIEADAVRCQKEATCVANTLGTDEFSTANEDCTWSCRTERVIRESIREVQGLHLTDKTLPPKNLPPKMAAAFHGNAGLMAAGMSYSYSLQKQTTSLYLYIRRHWNGRESRLNSCVSQFKTCN